VIEQAPTQSELLAIWERGEGERTGRRALALLAGAATGTETEELSFAPVGRRDTALLDLRRQLFGSRFTGVTSCPSCGEEIELTFDAEEVRRDAARSDMTTVNVDGFDLTVRLPSGADLAAIDSARDVAEARSMLFARCVTARDVALTIDDLPAHVVDTVVTRMGELDPQADVALDVDCPSCAHGWREPFDIVTFLWSELAAWARRLLSDIHLLASAYGWSEGDILRMTPVRRNAYLEMLR
jgi:hypothetical protein